MTAGHETATPPGVVPESPDAACDQSDARPLATGASPASWACERSGCDATALSWRGAVPFGTGSAPWRGGPFQFPRDAEPRTVSSPPRGPSAAGLRGGAGVAAFRQAVGRRAAASSKSAASTAGRGPCDEALRRLAWRSATHSATTSRTGISAIWNLPFIQEVKRRAGAVKDDTRSCRCSPLLLGHEPVGPTKSERQDRGAVSLVEPLDRHIAKLDAGTPHVGIDAG